jgi:hypothetical protein
MWAVGEKTLSLLPGGLGLYRWLGGIVKTKSQGTGPQLATAFPVARKAKELLASGATVVDVGTGWFHHDAFLLYLVGDYTVHLFDIEDRAKLRYIKNYLRYLCEQIAWVSRELGIDPDEGRRKLIELLELPDRKTIYARSKFVPCITSEIDRPFLPEGSVDLMVSNCVLVHMRPDIIVPELQALRSMLKNDGYMFHMLGHDDHWAFHDPAMEWPSFNYLRYSERAYRLLFDSALEYHNRMVRPEWLKVFAQAGLEVKEYEAVINDQSRDSVRRLPQLAPRYALYSVDDLAVIYSYVLLQPQRAGADTSKYEPLIFERADITQVARSVVGNRF